MLTYKQAREYMEQAAKKGSVLGLESITRLMKELAWEETVPMVHIAGTNGKGSVGAYLASIFREAGLRVARYTSPAVFEEREVIQIDGTYISKEEYALLVTEVKDACEHMDKQGLESPTVFEIETALAFLYFQKKKPDVALVEVGMGGLTDATNIIQHPVASIITTISFDHMQFLGNSLKEIAKVKAGIMKEGCPVFSASQQEEVVKVLQQEAKIRNTEIQFVEDSALRLLEQSAEELVFSYEEEEKNIRFVTQMSGTYQMKNAALAYLCGKEILPVLMKHSNQSSEREENRLKDTTEQGKESEVEAEKILDYISNGIKNARWPGRFEIIQKNPYVVIDGAHNEDAAKQLAKTLQNCFTNKRIHYIIGVLADKEHEKMLKELLPLAKKVYTITPDNPRAMAAEDLAMEAKRLVPELSVMICGNCKDAFEQAKKNAEVVVCFGSLSYLWEIKNCLSDKN